MAKPEPKDDDLPAIDNDSRDMLEDDVKKGKARKFILVCKGAQIRSLVVFKKGPYGPRINSTKSSGFRGEFYCGVITGKGVNLDLQLPGNKDVSDAMNAEGNVYDKVPCKVSKLRTFFAEEAELKFQPEITIITSLADVARVDEEDSPNAATGPTGTAGVGVDEVSGRGDAGSSSEDGAAIKEDPLKQKLIDTLTKLTTLIRAAIAAAPERKTELLEQAAAIRKLIQSDELNDAKTGIVEYGALLKQIAAAAPNAGSTTTESGNEDAAEYDRRLKAIMPDLKQALAANGPLTNDLKTAAGKAQSLRKQGQHEAALAALNELEELIETASAAGEQSDAAPQTGAEKWQQRLAQIEARYHEALDQADDEFVKKLRVLFTYATEQAEAKQYAKALAALDRLEPILEAAEADIAAAADAELDELIQTGSEDFDAFRECLSRWNEAVRDVRRQVDELKAAVLASYPDEAAAVDRLEEVFDGLDWWLERQLGQGLAAPSAQARQAIATEVRALADEYAEIVESNPMIEHADANPFGVTVRIEETLREPLEEMLMHLHFEA